MPDLLRWTLGWFLSKRTPAHVLAMLATPEERETLLQKQHPLFRPVDRAFHLYLEVLLANPAWNDGWIVEELRWRRVDVETAQELVSFAPLAFGRVVAEGLGVVCSDVYILHNLVDGRRREAPLAMEMCYVYARAMITLYRTEARNAVFMQVAQRSAEVAAINQYLHNCQYPQPPLGCVLGPPQVPLRRRAWKG